MSVKAIPNQPIQFDVTNDACTCASVPYMQLVDTQDVSQVQFEISPCLWNDNLITNGGFTSSTGWTVTDSFTIDTVNNLATKASGGIGTLQQHGVFNVGGFYIMEIIVDSITETAQVWESTQQLGNVDGVGRFVFAFQAVGDSLSIRSFSTTNEMSVASISAFEIDSRLLVGIFDLDGTYQNAITLANDPDYFTFTQDRMTVNIDWNALSISAGCYYIGIADPCLNTNGQNGNQDPLLLNQSLWTESAGANVTYSWIPEGGVIYSATDFSPNGLLELEDQNVVYGAGIDYTIEVDILSGGADTQIYAHIGSASANTAVTTGTLTLSVTGAGATPYFKLGLQPNAIPTSTKVIVKAVRVSLTNLSDMVPDSQSVDLKVGTHDCSVLLNANCNEDALGFVFENSLFNPRLRVEGELINPSYESTRTTIEDTEGRMRVLYGERKKAYQLIIGLVPEYILDFISLLPVFDNIWVDGDEYFTSEDAIDIEYPDGTANSGRVVMNLIEQATMAVNTSVSGTTNDTHAMVDDYIVDPRINDLIITEPSSGDTVKAI